MSLSLKVQFIQGRCHEGCRACGQKNLQGLSIQVEHELTDDTSDPVCVPCLTDGKSTPTMQLLLEAPPPPVLPLRGPGRRIQRKSQQQERRFAEDVGGRVQKASGALPGHKGDIRKKGVYRGEAKFTKAASFTITRGVLNKIRSECAGAETPVLQVDFVEPQTLRTEDSWVCIPYDSWVELQNAARIHQ